MKKEKKMTITVKYYILLLLLLLSLFVALIYVKKQSATKNKVSSKIVQNKIVDSKKESTNEVYPDEELAIDSPIAQELINKINVFDSSKAGSYYGYFYNQDYLDINGISNDAKVMIGITQNKNFKNDFINATYDAVAPDGTNLDVIILSKEEVSEGINSFFGPNTEYSDTSLIDAKTDYCGFSGFEFDDTRNVYMNNPISCSGFPLPYIDTKVMRVFRSGNIIEVTLKVAYIKFDSTNKDNVIKYIYADNNSSKYIEKHHLLTDNSYHIDNVLDKLNTYKFTFTLNSNNYYYFTKVEKV